MTLAPEWKTILKKAWSMRLMFLAGLLTAVEFLLPYWSEALPRGLFAGLSMAVITAAMVARIVAQKDLP